MLIRSGGWAPCEHAQRRLNRRLELVWSLQMRRHALQAAERVLQTSGCELICGPISRREFSAHSTWWWRLAIHWRPEAVRFRYSMPSSRCIETVFQKNSGYLSTRSAGDEYPSFRFMPVSSNSWKSAFTFLVYMGSPSCPIRSAAWTRRGRTSASVAFLSGGDGNRVYSIALAIHSTSIPGDFPSRSMANSFERSTW